VLLLVEFFTSEKKYAFWDRLNKKLGIAKEEIENA
jgi:hypothetical protein